LKRFIRSDSLDSADYEGYDKYIGVVEGMIDQGDDIEDVIDYIKDLYQKGKIENYEKNMLRRDAHNRAIEKEQAELTDADLEYYYGHKPGTYRVSAFANDYMEPVGSSKTFSDPGKAIEQWCKYQKKYPSCAMITGYPGKDERKLRDWALDHEDEFRDLCSKYNVPYKVDWLLGICRQGVRETNNKQPDQLSPFGLG